MTVTNRFAFTKITQQWTVPLNLDGTVHVELGGAGGPTTDDGHGGLVSGDATATPGDVWNVWVGGVGEDATFLTSAGGKGGFNGGGNGGASTGAGGFPGLGGSGATDIRVGGNGLANRIAVAAGAGGRGRNGHAVGIGGGGGDGGAGTGQAGTAGTLTNHGGGGGGGTQSAGGAAGAGGGDAVDGHAGVLGKGGDGSNHVTNGYRAGGGGGGGYYGGGGGGGAGTSDGTGYASGGGGAGSNYIGGLTGAIVTTRGAGSAPRVAGYANLTYSLLPNQPYLLLANNANAAVEQPVAVSWFYSNSDATSVQGAADVRWRVGSGAWTTIVAAVSDTTNNYGIAAHTFDSYVDQPVEWQIRTASAETGHYGPWSASRFFTPRTTPPAPTVGPITVDSPAPVVSWSATRNAIGRLVEMSDDPSFATKRFTGISGVAVPAGTTATATVRPTLPYVNGNSYYFRVQYWCQLGVPSPWTTVGPVVANIDAPLQPVLAVSAVEETGSVRIGITNPGSDPHPPDHNDVYRTDLATNVEIRIATAVALNGNYTDWTPGFNRSYRYRVQAVTADGAITSSD